MQGVEQSIDTKGNINLDGKNLSIAIVQSRFNDHLTQALANACLKELLLLGVDPGHIRHVTVPGALEVPIALDFLAQANQFDALVALGCVVRGETYHFELVANESAAGVSKVSFDHRVPVVNGILTVENQAQALVRVAPVGMGCARTAVEMANLRKEML
jgi:6,7-dimethyl-8-ribityllumazine synthase